MALVIVSGFLLASSNVEAQRIGIYGPGDDISAPYFPPGSTYTLISEATWNSMTTADFAAYDIIWIEAANCTSTNVQATAIATQATWSAAVDGRVTFASGDMDYHAIRDNARARDFVARLVNYLSAGGGTALMLNTGCLVTYGSVTVDTYATAIGSPLTQSTTSGYDPSVLNTTHPLIAAGSSTGLDSLAAFSVPDMSWGATCHGAIGAFPAGFVSVYGRGSDH